MKDNKKIVKTKQDLAWNLVFYYLQLLYGYPVIRKDEGFFELFTKLCDYVTNMISPPYDADFKEVYVVVEQEVPIE